MNDGLNLRGDLGSGYMRSRGPAFEPASWGQARHAGVAIGFGDTATPRVPF